MGSVLFNVFNSTATFGAERGVRPLLIVRLCCLQLRQGVDVLQPKWWFSNLHDCAVVVVCAGLLRSTVANVRTFRSDLPGRRQAPRNPQSTISFLCEKPVDFRRHQQWTLLRKCIGYSLP